MKIFKKAKWIWKEGVSGNNTYVSFKSDFTVKDKKNVKVKLSQDSYFCMFINGKIVGFSVCADYPKYKMVDTFDISKNVVKGKNTVEICVWYHGLASQTYLPAKEGLIYEIYENEEVIDFSSEKTLSRNMNEYSSGDIFTLTSQLGYSFKYDNTVKREEYSSSKLNGKKCNLFYRQRKNLVLSDRHKIKIEKLEGRVLIDLGEETAGFLDFDFISPKKQNIEICYGEWLKDGKVNKIIGDRNFSVNLVAKKGDNKYTNYFRRIAGRYLEIYSKEDIEINYIGLLPVNYPMEDRKCVIKDELLQKIYDTSVNTLHLCMHEHYEDCPWREQALYTLDSRNQMLFGYYCFKDYSYQRFNLDLIAKSMRKDGLLSLNAAAGLDFPIPSFSLVYILQVYEYVKYTGDKSILKEALKNMNVIMKTFKKRIDKTGLIASFPYPFWNFFEWSEGADNESEITRKKDEPYILHYDFLMNAMYIYFSKFYSELSGKKVETEKMKKALIDMFYDKKKGVYLLVSNNKIYSQLANAFAILIGIGDEKLAEKIINDKKMIPATLSMRTFLYDSLLTFKDKYKDYIIEDIKFRYGKMLEAGATTFWETENGGREWQGSGSECHGWSAIPIYYLNVLGLTKYKD